MLGIPLYILSSLAISSLAIYELLSQPYVLPCIAATQFHEIEALLPHNDPQLRYILKPIVSATFRVGTYPSFGSQCLTYRTFDTDLRKVLSFTLESRSMHSVYRKESTGKNKQVQKTDF